ncbi:MAG: vWA domain-containing protein [Phenylobacterium sp.]|uniref:vWA domain-containing protein n=1 Tax=Phenylobacterium sp. TaxID=1871053 RepID=UPI00391ACCA9
MARPIALRSVSVVLLAALTAASAPAGAAPRAGVLDGEVTPEACARLGFPAASGAEVRFGSPRVGLAAPPPPAPPMASPMVQGRIGEFKAGPQEVTVTASRRRGPPRVETERYPDATPNPVKRAAEDPVSTFSIDVDTAAYANVRRFLNDGQAPPSDAVRVEELVNYFDYGYAPPTDRRQPFSTYAAVVPSPWSKDRQILHIGLQGYDIPRAEQPPLNLVFLVDTSGSMWGPDRLPLAQKALNILIDQLRPQDRVAMVAYAGSAGAVLAPTDGRQKLKMRCALGALRAGGSTAGGQGLALAYDLAGQNFDPKAVNRVILLTDGDFNVGVTDDEKLEDFVAAKRKTGVYLSVYGFGRGNYQDARMQVLAQNGNGAAAYIDTLAEARKLLRDDLAGSLFPIADDVKIQVEFNPAQVSEYRLIGYETRLLNREDFNNDRVDAGEVGSGASVTALYEITPAGARPSSDPLRYSSPASRAGPSGELAYLKIRYKRPGEGASHLIERPITRADVLPSLATAPEATRWALAVAGFGQKLRGDPWVDPAFGWAQVIDLAQGARGEDPFGLRAEFVQLARAADGARTLNETP